MENAMILTKKSHSIHSDPARRGKTAMLKMALVLGLMSSQH